MYARRVVISTLATQTLMSMSSLMLIAVSPVAAAALGIDVAVIGFQTSIIFTAAMSTVLFGGTFVRRLGGCRTSQIALIMCTAGCLLCSVPSLAAIAAGSLVIGLAYGLPAPAASHLLARFTGEGRRNLIFSLKQAGVPLGGALAGLVGPSLAVNAGWQAPLLLNALLACVLAGLLQLVRPAWDDDRSAEGGRWRLPLESIAIVLRSSALRALGLAAGLLSFVQTAVVSYLVVALVEELGFGAVVAGMVLAGVQTSSAAGRIVWGWMADRLGHALWIVVALTVVLIGLLAAGSALRPTTSHVLVIAVYLAIGASAASWNGIFMAETARLAPLRHLGDVTACMLFLSWSGALIGPSAFALLQFRFGVLASYPLLMAVALAACVLVVLAAIAAARRPPVSAATYRP